MLMLACLAGITLISLGYLARVSLKSPKSLNPNLSLYENLVEHYSLSEDWKEVRDLRNHCNTFYTNDIDRVRREYFSCKHTF